VSWDLSVGMWRASGNPNSCTDLNETLHAHIPAVQGRFWGRFDLRSVPIRAWGPETLKAEEHILKNAYKTKDVQQSSKLTRAALGTSVSFNL